MRIQNMTRLAAVCLIVSLASIALAADPPGPGPERLERMFRALDRNDDGRIELDEFVDRAPEAGRQMRAGPPPSPEGQARRSHPEEIEHRINEMVERRVNEILDRRIHEFVEERLPRIIEERMQGSVGRGPMSAWGKMGRSRGRDWDRPGSYGRDWDRGRDRDRQGKPGGRAWACQPPGRGQKGPGAGRAAGDRRGPRSGRGDRGPRGRGADRRRGGLGNRPLFRMFDADRDGKIQAEEIKRLADRFQEALGLQEGGAITLKDWDRIARERAEKWRKDQED